MFRLRTSRRILLRSTLASIAALGLVGAFLAPGAGAAERGQAPTEDDDSNDGGTPNDVADERDNAHPSGKDRSVESGGSGTQGKATSDPDDDGRGPDRTNGGPDKADGSGGVDLADQDGNNGCGNDDDFEDDNEGWCGRPPTTGPDAAAATSACPSGMIDTNGTELGGCKEPGCGKGKVHASKAANGAKGAATRDDDDTCVVPGSTSTPCPAGSFDANGAAMAAGCTTPDGAVLGEGVMLFNAGLVLADGRHMMGEVMSIGLEAPAETASVGGTASAELASTESVSGRSLGALAFTGANVLVLLAVALGLLGLGYLLVRTTRRTRTVA